MENPPLTNALNRVRAVATAGYFTDESDSVLLDRCVSSSDEAAMAALVHRHGAMVHAVCSRIVRHRHDAEDACQATFLVLARRSASIRKRPSVASWLHGVARRVSLTLVRERIARQQRERTVPAVASASEPPDRAWSEVQTILDEELDRLPESLKGPLVLCYLQGKTRDEAAASLGLTHGRLHGLLQRGRTRLHDRLVRRGVSLGAGLLAAGLSGSDCLALPPTLAVRIITGATAMLRPDTVPAATVTPSALLANEALKTMTSSKLTTAMLCAIVCFTVAAVAIASSFARPEDKPPPAAVRAPEAKPAPLEFRKVLAMPAEKPNDFRHAVIAVGHEQKAVLSRNLIITDRDDPKATSAGLHLWSLDEKKPKQTKLGDSTTLGFIPKTTLGYAVYWGGGVVLWDTRTHTKVGEPFPHELREDTMPQPAVRPDGGAMATRSQLKEVQVWDLKTRKPMAPAVAQRGIVQGFVFSADSQFLFSFNEPGEVTTWDAATGLPLAGPFRHDAYGRGSSYHPKTQRYVTVENSRDKEKPWQSELLVRSAKDGNIARRVKVDAIVREVQWLDETRLLIVGQEKAKFDVEGRPISYGRNRLQVLTLDGEKNEFQTLVQNIPWIRSYVVAADGKHIVICTTGGGTQCWRIGEAKPLWTKPGGETVHCGDGDWTIVATKDSATAYSLAEGQELWKHAKLDAVRVEGADVYTFGPSGIEVWHVGRGEK